MENLIKTLRSKRVANGKFYVTIEFEGVEVGVATTNTMAIDAAFDDCYDNEVDEGRYYESQKEAQESLVNDILTANDIEL